MICNWHLCTKELVGRQRKFCSNGCKNKEAVTNKRRSNKLALVEMFGGKCMRCGYDKCPQALQFHHKDDNKSFGIAHGGSTRALDSLIEEASKCDLICANCHAEEHYWHVAD